MNPASLHDFLTMGGYGGYVWGSFGVVLVSVAAEVLALRQRFQLARLHARLTRRRGAP
jgi:heme exporter protein D